MFERHNWVWLLIAALLLTLALVAPLGGRKGNLQSTTAPVEKTFSGTIEAVNQHRCEICNWVELSVILKTDAGRMEVRLGPKTFFEEHDFYIVARRCDPGRRLPVYGERQERGPRE
jgi:rubredoxin